MIDRRLRPALIQRLAEVPAVVLLGPRQCGKTTLARTLADTGGALYLDLESPGDLAKLAEPELYLGDHLGRLVIVDEIHRVPGLFPILRGLIDRGRSAGRRHGLYLLLGSASLALLEQAGETLAGRVSLVELAPFDVLEVGATSAQRDLLWTRGGFPESYLAPSDALSLRWRQDFIRTYLERDIPQFGRRIAAETLRRFWGMLAHYQGAPLNVAQLASGLGIDAKTTAAYVDLLVDLLLVRRLPPWLANVGKRLVKSPRVYVRDSGIVHALLALPEREALLSHPIVGGSWEGFVVESLLSVAPAGTEGYFYRTSGGAEIDLLLRVPGGQLWAIDIKRSMSPRPERGFHAGCEDVSAARRFVAYPGEESYRIGSDTQVIPLAQLARLVVEAAGP
jgi:predicted AAA+ superfamily ATPase